jgi:type III secretion system HrpE/YscL family protein
MRPLMTAAPTPDRSSDKAFSTPALFEEPTPMSFVVLHRIDGEPNIAVSATRIERKRFASLQSAAAVLGAAQTAAANLRDESEQLLAQQECQARETGFAQGLSDGMVAVLGTLETERRLRQLLADRMADVVEQCVRSLLGDIGPTDVFQQRVRHLLRNNPSGSNATLHVCPAQAHLAQAVLNEQAATLAATGGELTWLTIYSDEQCAPDALVLETRVGFVDASIDLTLAHARDIISRAVQGAAMRMGM